MVMVGGRVGVKVLVSVLLSFRGMGRLVLGLGLGLGLG